MGNPPASFFQNLSNRLSHSLDRMGVQLMDAGGLAVQKLVQHVHNIVDSVKESFGKDLSPAVSDFLDIHSESNEKRSTESKREDSVMRPD